MRTLRINVTFSIYYSIILICLFMRISSAATCNCSKAPEENHNTKEHTGRQAEQKNDFLTPLFYGAVAGAGFLALVTPIVFTLYWVLKKQRCLKQPRYYVVRIELIEGFRRNHGNRGTKQRVESHRDKTGGHYATLV